MIAKPPKILFRFWGLKKSESCLSSLSLQGMLLKFLFQLSLLSFRSRIQIPNPKTAARQFDRKPFFRIFEILSRNHLGRGGSLAGLWILFNAHCCKVLFNLAALGPCKL